MNPNRLRWGALTWLLTLQFFVVEAIAQARYGGPYSRADDVISVLGEVSSPAHRLMNASFVVQGALILGGALLLRPVLRGLGARVAPVLLGIAGIGVLLVGVVPSDANSTLHTVGALMYLGGGGLGLIALAYAVRSRSEALGTTLALVGLIGTALTIFFVAGVTEYLGTGGTERVAAYTVPVGLAIAGAALWRMGAAPEAGRAGDEGAGRRNRKEERARARAQHAEQARLRDAALEAAARRSTDASSPAAAGSPATGEPAAGPGATDTGDDDEIDLDDPWAPRRRGGR